MASPRQAGVEGRLLVAVAVVGVANAGGRRRGEAAAAGHVLAVLAAAAAAAQGRRAGVALHRRRV